MIRPEGFMRLERSDPSRNAFRFYKLDIQPDLFDHASLLISWGRIGHPGRQAVRSGGTMADVVKVRDRLLKVKIRKGYRDMKDRNT